MPNPNPNHPEGLTLGDLSVGQRVILHTADGADECVVLALPSADIGYDSLKVSFPGGIDIRYINLGDLGLAPYATSDGPFWSETNYLTLPA